MSYFEATSLQARHKPGALLELAMDLQAHEQSMPSPQLNNVNVTFDSESGTASITATLPITFSADGYGQPIVVATDYLP